MLKMASFLAVWTTALVVPPPAANRVTTPARCTSIRLSEDTGKFVRHNELSPGCSPLGVLVAGLSDEQLEAVAEVVEDTFIGAEGEKLQHVPIVVLSQQDLSPRIRLRDILAKMTERDSELPERPAMLEAPLVMLSGFSTVQTSATVRAISTLGLRGGQMSPPPPTGLAALAGMLTRGGGTGAQSESAAKQGSKPMFAVVVPNALDKSLRVLVDELEGDHRANA